MDGLRSIIKDLKISFRSDINNTLREELDAMEVEGTGFVYSNIILSKLEKMLVQNQ